MKFSCDSCGKKYATADDPAPGRVYKIKCKACGHLIVVKPSAGGAPAAHHEPSAAPPPLPSSEIALEVGAPEPDAPPPWPNETRARSAEPTAHVAMPAAEEPTPPPADGGYVDLFSETGASPLSGSSAGSDPFAAAGAPLGDDFGVGASSLPDPFAPVREVKAHETVTPEPPPMPKVPVIPKPAQQKSIVPVALMGGGVALLLGIVAFVVLSRGGSSAPPPAPAPAAKPVVAAAPQAAPVVAPEPAPPPPAPEVQPTPPPPAVDAAAEARKAAEGQRRREREEAAARAERTKADRAERERAAREEKARAAAEAKERADKARADRAERERSAREEKARATAEARERARAAAEEKARAAAEAKERAKIAAEEKAARIAREREERAQAARDDRVAAATEAEEAQSLTQAQIEGVLRASKPSFDSCMRAAAGGDVKLDGRRIMLRLNIQPSGAVTYPTIDDVVVNGADLGTCIKGAARSMLFPKFSGDTMHIEVPVALR